MEIRYQCTLHFRGKHDGGYRSLWMKSDGWEEWDNPVASIPPDRWDFGKCVKAIYLGS